MIRFQCEECGHPLQAAVEWAGKRVKCPRCEGVVLIPAGGKARDLSNRGAATPFLPQISDHTTGEDAFEQMVQAVKEDNNQTGARLSRREGREGSYCLLAAAAVQAILSIVVWVLLEWGGRSVSTSNRQFMTGVSLLHLLAVCLFVALFFWAKWHLLSAALVGLLSYCLLLMPSTVTYGGCLVWALELFVVLFLAHATLSGLSVRRWRASASNKRPP